MKKFKLLGIFLIAASIGLASMSTSSARYEDISRGTDLKNVMFVVDGNYLTKYTSTAWRSEEILNDIKSVIDSIRGKTIYVRDYSMYQRLKMAGASDITNSSDGIVKEAKFKYGYNIYMLRF